MRRVAKVDANQAAVVEALRKIGAEVTHLHTLGQGVSDLLVSFRQRWFLLEVKDGSKIPSKQRLTKDEADWIGRQKAPVHIVKSSLEAVELLQRTP